jgi:hypothetical protein
MYDAGIEISVPEVIAREASITVPPFSSMYKTTRVDKGPCAMFANIVEYTQRMFFFCIE